MSVPTTGYEFDVFLSYHSGDAEWVGRLRRELQAKGAKVWLDSEQILPGDRFAEVLERGLQASRTVALVVSRGSLASDWVKEEYYRALGLANSTERRVRLIPVLIDSVPLPGFLASRSWADFRSADSFEQSVERLCKAIFADGGEPVSPEPTSKAVEEAPVSTAELEYLDSALTRERSTVRRLYAALTSSVVVGLGIALAYRWHESDASWFVTAALPCVMGLAAWGATAGTLARSKPNLERLFHLKGALDLCSHHRGSGCPKIWAEFWRTVHRNAGVDTA
jgi:hypothetical protein